MTVEIMRVVFAGLTELHVDERPGHTGMRAGLEGDHLQRDVRLFGGFTRRCVNCARMTFGPPTMRRIAASSTMAHTSSGSSLAVRPALGLRGGGRPGCGLGELVVGFARPGLRGVQVRGHFLGRRLVNDGVSVTHAARTLKISRSTAYAALVSTR